MDGGVQVVRFIRPDLRRQLDSRNIEDCALFKEVHTHVLAEYQAGHKVIFNFGLVERFPTAFYQLLVKAREVVHPKNGRVILCGFAPEIQEALDILQAPRLFEICHKEEQAVQRAKASD
jgi:anti-anti-sigma regulatory factor